MEITIYWSDKLGAPHRKFREFVQEMANRINFGHARHGFPNFNDDYWGSLKKEMEAYNHTGNKEHLYNIANFAELECRVPSHPKHHYAAVKSVNRNGKRKIGE